MKKKTFSLRQKFPKFVAEFREGGELFDVTMRNLGYNSAEYDEKTDRHSLSEEDYTWFVLRWS